MANEAKRKKALSLSNLRLARSKWGDVDRLAVQRLKTLSNELQLSIASGDLLLLDAHWTGHTQA